MKKKDLKPYTKEELQAMIATSEHQFATGQWQDFDEAIDEIEEDLAREEQNTRELVGVGSTTCA